jgi:hypothetical protein
MWTTIIKIAWLLFKWFTGKQAERKKIAKEIFENFKKVEKEGAILWDDIQGQLNERSDTDWDDINVREG